VEHDSGKVKSEASKRTNQLERVRLASFKDFRTTRNTFAFLHRLTLDELLQEKAEEGQKVPEGISV
jgi:hypothetical protein